MPERIKGRIIRAACSMGGYRLARLLTRNHPRVLMYHRFSALEESGKVSAATFERQVIELKKNCNVRSLSDLFKLVREGNPLPPNTIAITVDDGYDDFYRIAYPILKRYGLPATIYITTDFIDGELWLWPDKITYILNNTSSDKTTLRLADGSEMVLSLLTAADRSGTWSRLIDHCLTLGEQDRWSFIENLGRDLAVDVDAKPPTTHAPMSWTAVREISENGIEIGAHTRSHPVLSRLNRDRLREEIHGSKKQLEDIIGKSVTDFCYPNGQPADYNDEVKRMVIDCGYSSATVAFHDKHVWKDPFEIRRYGVGADPVQFRKAIYGIEYLSDRLQ
ncbi:peptidoglycan/xylan/chitin deacetylase (PgdA/CDA1 family) [Methylohalomonas lacus]|uniref:Peptidoglycan/xylan/chitin deacetylase (PgdA/CDA1 family) n=1 Tax=Methylohalomonas lacus TaxID=398773 RepID=A0AAE3HP02_9GAMM|nr:polysaccharide deacetylase family protein [Methylohalomonas lacus]MCS3904322.1 peptidoglycan/xylan/chitin deacetylase (PgdA/CDA1 family) [Methylohalomonas lacus]